MADVTTSFLKSLFPAQEKIIPSNFQTYGAGWIEGLNGTPNNTFFRTQWIECSYQISGGYAPTPRYIFYFLCIVTIIGRKTSWAVPVALASVMLFSSSAAIHALVLASIRQQLVPKDLTENYQVILVDGSSATGVFEAPSTDPNAPVWLPILPMAWDNDGDPIVAIVGAAYLLLLPMQIWSMTLNKAKPEQKAIIFTWALLLLIGLICALVNEDYLDVWSFPQLRFCPPDQEDILPITNSGVPSVAGQWDGQDWYQWNRTVQDYFIYKNLSVQPPNVCLYPCFDSSWPLRDPSDIFVVDGTFGSGFETNTSYSLLVVVYVLVAFSGLASLTILIMKLVASTAKFSDEWRDIRAMSALRKIKQAWKGVVANPVAFTSYEIFAVRLWIVVVTGYALILSPIALVFLVAYMEWVMWESDPGGETFRHVGQWGVLVATLFVIGAAVIPWIVSKLNSKFFPTAITEQPPPRPNVSTSVATKHV